MLTIQIFWITTDLSGLEFSEIKTGKGAVEISTSN